MDFQFQKTSKSREIEGEGNLVIRKKKLLN